MPVHANLMYRWVPGSKCSSSIKETNSKFKWPTDFQEQIMHFVTHCFIRFVFLVFVLLLNILSVMIKICQLWQDIRVEELHFGFLCYPRVLHHLKENSSTCSLLSIWQYNNLINTYVVLHLDFRVVKKSHLPVLYIFTVTLDAYFSLPVIMCGCKKKSLPTTWKITGK